MYDIISEKYHYNYLVTTFMPKHNKEVAIAISKLKRAIAENNIRELENVLSEFSLLRSISISLDLFSDSKKRKLERVRQIFDAISEIKSPEMIYAILAAGFSPFDLGAIFKRKKDYKLYVMLTHIIPNLTSEQIQSLKDDDYPVCTYTREVARIPVNWLGFHYDLHSIFNALIYEYDVNTTIGLGYTNVLFEHDKLEIDLELIRRISHLFPEKSTNAQYVESMNKDLDEFNKPSEEILNKIQIKFYYINIYTFLATAFLFFTELQIDNYLENLPEEEAIRLSKGYHDLLKLAWVIILSTLSQAAKYIETCENEKYEIQANKLKFESSDLSFDYNSAQQNLIRDIPRHFANEFASEPKPASLLFWKQAFDAKIITDSSIEKTSTPEKIKKTRPLLKI